MPAAGPGPIGARIIEALTNLDALEADYRRRELDRMLDNLPVPDADGMIRPKLPRSVLDWPSGPLTDGMDE